VITSDGGLLAYREPDGAAGLTALTGDVLADARTGKNGRHDWSACYGSRYLQNTDAPYDPHAFASVSPGQNATSS
jgi:hypothetical protein